MGTLKFSPLKASVSSQSVNGKGNKLRKASFAEKKVVFDDKGIKKTPIKKTCNAGSGTSDSLDDSGSDAQVIVEEAVVGRVLTEEEEDLEDALSPMYDQLSLGKWWWVLEVLPLRHRVQQEDATWKREVTYVPFHSLIPLPGVGLVSFVPNNVYSG